MWLQRSGKMSVVYVSRWKQKVYGYLDGKVRSTALYCKHSRLIRLADNYMINGTKLLNVAGMTRGRRDHLLKLENTRHVVKTGLIHFKGVWYTL